MDISKSDCVLSVTCGIVTILKLSFKLSYYDFKIEITLKNAVRFLMEERKKQKT